MQQIIIWTVVIVVAVAMCLTVIVGTVRGRRRRAAPVRGGGRSPSKPIAAAEDEGRPSPSGETAHRGFDPSTGRLDYDEAVHLDAEDLAEGGIVAAYTEQIAPMVEAIGVRLRPVTEHADHSVPSYSVVDDGVEHHIYGPEIDDHDSWRLAAVALFGIVNSQLQHTPFRLYAISGGNDLFGILLTPEDARAARAGLPRESDWPYLLEADPA